MSTLSHETFNISTIGTETSASSISFARGPGALTGRFLVWLGVKAINTIIMPVIQKRLSVIEKAMIDEPHIFFGGSADATRIHEELEELCCSSQYPSCLRLSAARIVVQLAFLELVQVLTTYEDVQKFRSSLGASVESDYGDPQIIWKLLLARSFLVLRTNFVPTRKHGIQSLTEGVFEMTTKYSSFCPDVANQPSIVFGSETQAKTLRSEVEADSNNSGPLSPALSRPRQLLKNFILANNLRYIEMVIHRNPVLFHTHIFSGTPQAEKVGKIYDALRECTTRLNHTVTTRPATPNRIKLRAFRLVVKIMCIVSHPIYPTSNQGSDEGNLNQGIWAELLRREEVQGLLKGYSKRSLSRKNSAN